jgi:DNA (cytosine-5)-methyltransferase 1
MSKHLYSLDEAAKMLSVSKETLRRWDKNGKLKSTRLPNNYRVYTPETLKSYTGGAGIFDMEVMDEHHYSPIKPYKTIELFAGAGGLALGLEKAGLECELLNEVNKWACKTLKRNRPNWRIEEGDIANIDFSSFKGQIDIISGGFPCQAFSYAGKKLGFEDTRGTLFYEFSRAVKEVQPKIFIAENVRGLVSHDKGRTLKTMVDVMETLNYKVLAPKVLKAIHYQVPQKRERLFLIGIRKDLNIHYQYTKPSDEILVLADALRAGKLYPTDVPESPGQKYPESKKKIMELIPPGGYWRDLPEALQKDYMKKSFYLGGGKTGMARRIAWDEPCLTLTTSPAQKQTERCHPEETRPFTTREYARIQTFPDDWVFEGSMSEIYRQIGNAVPVNLAYAVAKEAVRALNLYTIEQEIIERFAS